MGGHEIAEIPEFPVDGVFSQGGLEGERIEEEVDILGEPLDEVPAFRQAGAAFEDDLVAGVCGHGPQGLGDVVVLLDDGRAQSLPAKVLCRPQYGLLKIRMFEQFHGRAAPWLANCGPVAVRPAIRSQIGTGGSAKRAGREVQGASSQAARPGRRAWRARGGLGAGDLEQPGKPAFLRQERQGSAEGFLRRQLAGLAPTSQEIEQRRIDLGQILPSLRATRVDQRVAADEFPGQAEGAGGNLTLPCALRGESEEIGGGKARGKDGLMTGGELPDGGGIRPALAESGLAGPVVDPLAQTLESPLASKARQGLRDGGEGEVAKVLKAPEAFAAAFDALPHQAR